MDRRKRFSDPLTSSEKQTVSFLNERQSIFKSPKKGEDVPDGAISSLPDKRAETVPDRNDPVNERPYISDNQRRGEDVPDGALSSLPARRSESGNEKKEPKKSNLKRENSKATRNPKGSEGGVSFELETGKVKFDTESYLKNNEKNVEYSPNTELVLLHNNLTSDDSSEEFEFRKHVRKPSSSLSASRMSISKSSTYTNRSSRDSDFDDELKFTTHLTVLKIIFIDILFSLGDHVTDFLQGFNLMFGDLLDVSIAAWSLDFLSQHWEQRGQYGLIVLLLNWSPGIIAVVHMLAYHRKEYAVQETSLILKTLVPGVMDFKTKREHQIQRRRKFFLTMILVLIFYPVIPAVTYILLLWGWGNGQAQPDTFSRRENFAMVAHSITGGFEAPVQLTMTIWLMLKGIIDNDFSFGTAFLERGLPTDKFGNVVPLPAIPVISSVSSLVSIMFACVRLNIPQPYQSYAEANFCKRHNKRYSQVMGHLPFFLCSVLFRVMSYAFMWLYLWVYSFIPLTVSFFANLVIGYNQQTDTKMKKDMKQVRKKIKKHCREKQEECKTRRLEMAIWLSSFIGIFIPCCYSQQLEDKIVKKLWDNPGILKSLDEVRQNFQKKVLKKQELVGTLINLISTVVIFLLVNYTDTYKYSDNKLTNFSFNIYFSVLSTLGVMCLGFTFLNFDALELLGLGHIETKAKSRMSNVTISSSHDEPDAAIALPTTTTNQKDKNIKGNNKITVKISERKTNKFVQFLVSGFLCLLVFAPIFCGGLYNHLYAPPEGFAILVPDPAATTNEMYMKMVKVHPVNSGTSEDEMDDRTGKVIACKDYFTDTLSSLNSLGKTLVVYTDLGIPECVNKINKRKFEERVTERNNKDILLIAENHPHRSSSAFPDKTFDDKRKVFTEKSIAFFKTYKGIPILSFNQKDKSVFEPKTNQEIRFAMKGINNLFNPAKSSLLSVECDENECIHMKDTDKLKGRQVFLGCDSEPKRTVNVTISCTDRGKNCTEFDRYKSKQNDKEKSCGNELVTPTYHGVPVPLKCNEKYKTSWTKRNDILICQNEELNEMKTIMCCTLNRTTIFAKKGCTEPKENHCEDKWGSWSGFNIDEVEQRRDRSRFCFIDKTCTYLETEYVKLNVDDRDKHTKCGKDFVFEQNKCDGY